MPTKVATKEELAELVGDESMRQQNIARCQRFRYFARKAWQVVEPGTTLLPGYHFDAICDHLQAIMDGQIKRLLINIAPGHGKSTLVSTIFPAYSWVRNSHLRWLCASYAMDLAIRDNKNCRDLIESEWYQYHFGETVQLARRQNQKSYFENTKRGYRLCTAVRSSGTGKRANALLIDDPNNAMAGPADIQATVEWYGKTWVSRLNDPDNGIMVIVGQRLHEKDLSGHVLSLGGWEHLNLPTEFEPERRCFTSIGWSDPRTEPGELLWPEMYDTESLAILKKALGSIHYAAQYQQAPVPSEGATFKKQWLRYFRIEGEWYVLKMRGSSENAWSEKRIPINKCRRYITVDLAISSKQEADFTVIAVWALTPSKELLLLDMLRDHLDNPDQKKALEFYYHQWQPIYLAIESVAYQLALVQQLRKGKSTADDFTPSFPVKEYKPVKDKVSRASSAAVRYEAEQVFHLENAVYLIDFEKELLLFPKADHDDCVDVVSMMCDLVTLTPTAQDHIDWAKRYAQARLEIKQKQLAAADPLPASTTVEPLKEPNPNAKDFLVDTANPEALDLTLSRLPRINALVVGGGSNPTRVDGYVVVRCLGDVGFLKFAIERQGYGRIIRQLDQLV